MLVTQVVLLANCIRIHREYNRAMKNKSLRRTLSDFIEEIRYIPDDLAALGKVDHTEGVPHAFPHFKLCVDTASQQLFVHISYGIPTDGTRPSWCVSCR